MLSNYKLEHDSGDAWSAKRMNFYLYPYEIDDVNDLTDDILPTIIDLGDDLISNNALEYYRIYHFQGPDDDNEHDSIGQGRGFRSDKRYQTTKPRIDDWNFIKFKRYIHNTYPLAGVHMAVVYETNFANAEHAKSPKSAWQQQAVSSVGTAGNYSVGDSDKARYLNLAVQEPVALS